jgi:azurin
MAIQTTLRTRIALAIATALMAAASFAQAPIEMNAVTNDDGTMTYDKKELKVTAGQTVTIKFTNPDTAQHNFLLAQPGSMKIIGAAADKFVRDDTGEDVNYVPKLPQIIYVAPVLEPKKTTTFSFKAPAKPGQYVIICTFPGHWKTMNAVLNVVAK